MVIIDNCKNCGSSIFKIATKNGYDFLTCSHCESDVAILTKDDKSSKTIESFFHPSGEYTDYISCSGIMFSGFPISGYYKEQS